MFKLNLDIPDFLNTYWQKKPVIIKNAFSHFADPISADEIAGLSLEEMVDSRFVTNKDAQWTAQHGPFEESFFDTLPETHCQLIVQACNHWHSETAQLIEPFKALPHWLFDDVMVCYSAPHGGVGPHIDQYDVFIIQGQGKREWKVGAKDIGQYTEVIQGGALRQIEGFDAIIDDILLPGDMLYIPPGFPHEGTTLEASLSYSLGYRSPTEQELLSHFADHTIANDLGNHHMHDPDLPAQSHYGQIGNQSLTMLKQMLHNAMNADDVLNTFIGTQLSQSRHQMNLIEPDPEYRLDELNDLLQQSVSIEKVPGLKALYLEGATEQLFVNGECFTIHSDDKALLSLLCDQNAFNSDDIVMSPQLETRETLLTLINSGYWYIA
ncbi:cupin domain-containing protein [Vibrio renipiscarius]|uniref:ribosomal protein uL16 3-hydroxylase n=1 Tax=Vibrio renipiscarius TaxID=1461322 RepID=UPI00354B158C